MLHSPGAKNGGHSFNRESFTAADAAVRGRTKSRSPIPPSLSSPVKDKMRSSVVVQAQSSTWLPGSEVVAQYSFAGSSSEDLPFMKGQILLIEAPTQDPNWYIASNSKSSAQGLIPANYVIPYDSGVSSLHLNTHDHHYNHNHDPPPNNTNSNHMSWFHGKISRDVTESILLNKPDGTFLVRESTNFPGDFTLCLAFESKVEHYRIKRSNSMFTCDNEEFFDDLIQLVAHYKRDADGLVHRLVTALPIKRPSPKHSPKHHHQHINNNNNNTVTHIHSDQGEDQVDSVNDQTRVFKDAGWCIRRHDLSLGDLIGHGEFGDVHVGYYKEQKVAVKVLKQCSGVLESLLGEAQLMTSLKHTNLVQLLGVVLDDISDVFMVTEFMANGNLVDYLRSRGRHQVDRLLMLQMAIDVCSGMAYLEAAQLVHRDLAARNILLSEEMVANISDFGLAKHADTSSLDTQGKFPIKWTAPEALRYSKFTNKSDMWSFGVLLWEIYSFGRVPYPRIPIQDVMRHIERGYRMEPPEACPKVVSALMTKAWQLKADERPTFAHMLTLMHTAYDKLKTEPVGPSTTTVVSSQPPNTPALPPPASTTVTITINSTDDEVAT